MWLTGSKNSFLGNRALLSYKQSGSDRKFLKIQIDYLQLDNCYPLKLSVVICVEAFTLKVESFAGKNFHGDKLSRTPIAKIKFRGYKLSRTAKVKIVFRGD